MHVTQPEAVAFTGLSYIFFKKINWFHWFGTKLYTINKQQHKKAITHRMIRRRENIQQAAVVWR